MQYFTTGRRRRRRQGRRIVFIPTPLFDGKKVMHTFLIHAELEALLKSAVLALVTMVLIDGTVMVSATRVGQITSHRTLEEALAALARQYAVMFTGTFVSANNAFEAGTDDGITAAVLSTGLD